MGAKIFIGCCVVLAINLAAVAAVDTPAQAAARAALEQKLLELDQPQSQPPPKHDSPTIVQKPVEPVIQPATNVVHRRSISLQPDAVAKAPAPARVEKPAVMALSVTTFPAKAQPSPAPVARPVNLTLTGKEPSNSTAEMELASATLRANGANYQNVRVEKVVSDGVLISYTPASGGIGFTKIYFKNQPAKPATPSPTNSVETNVPVMGP